MMKRIKMPFDVGFLPISVFRHFSGFKIDEILFVKWKIKTRTKLRVTDDRFIYGLILFLFLVALNFNGA